MNALARPAAAMFRLRPLAARLIARFPYTISALDRIGLSLFSFALNLALVRLLSATDFGIVALWMTLALLAVDLQSALVRTPLNVHIPGAGDERTAARLKAAVASVNAALVAAVMVVAAAAVAAMAATGGASLSVAAGFAILLYVATGMYREYYRNIAFGERDMALLLRVDVPYLVVTAACLAAVIEWRGDLAGVGAAFLVMSLGSAASQLLMRQQSRRPALFRAGWLQSYRSILSDVSWALVGTLASHIRSRSYIYIATSLAGLAAMATLNIANLLFRPLNLLMTAWSSAALPRLAALIGAGNIGAFSRMLGCAMAVGAVGSLAWFGLLALAWGPISHHLLAGKYPEARTLLLPCAVASGLWVLHSVATIGLAAAREFKFLAQVDVVCAVVSAAGTAAMILWQGYGGAMWGVAASYAVAFALEIVRVRGVRRRPARPLEVSAAPLCAALEQ